MGITLQASLWGTGFLNATNQKAYSLPMPLIGVCRSMFGPSRFAFVMEQTPPTPSVYLGTTSDYSQYWGPGS